MTTLLLTLLGLSILCLIVALLFYPVLQSFGVVACNCGKSPEDKWRVGEENQP